MFIDSNTQLSDNTFSADVCIIGSGPAGLSLARTLIEFNKTVVFIERGGHTAAKPSARDVIFKNHAYDGIQNGLAFGYGGTGSLWGGQLIPMLDDELAQLGTPWSSAEFIETLRKHTEVIENWVGVSSATYFQSLLSLINHESITLRWNEFFPIFSKWIPFRQRNLGSAWAKHFQNSKLVKILLNTQPISCEFTNDTDKTIKTIICQNDNGNDLKVNATYFVVAAGALESPLVLQKLLGEKHSETLGIGHYLHDHLSLRIAELTNYSRNEFEQLFSQFFTGSTMRSLRLCLPIGDNIPSYCHFVIEAPENSGFALARDFLRGLQAKNYLTAFKSLFMLPMAFGDITRMLWIRYFKNRLALSKNSRIYINFDFVKQPSIKDSIYFNKDKIVINWNIDEDLVNFTHLAFSACNRFWSENGLHNLGTLEQIHLNANQANNIDNIYDIYHPAGTCATGRVVDSEFKIFGTTNCFVAGSSIFPLLGRSNPTLTIMALSRQLGFTLAKLLNTSN